MMQNHVTTNRFSEYSPFDGLCLGGCICLGGGTLMADAGLAFDGTYPFEANSTPLALPLNAGVGGTH